MDNEVQDELESIAIIGMDGRFPGAKDLDQFWNNLRDGVESISFFSDEELRAAGVSEPDLNNPAYVKAKSCLEDIEVFDARFFGFSPIEAEFMDPQHRMFLECGWHAVENAGYNPESYHGAIGVYAGNGLNRYLLFNLHSHMASGNLFNLDKDFLATRLSYKLNLKGPSMTIQTACSTSLVAVCEACQSLLDYRCDMALAGGVTLVIPPISGYHFKEGGILSPDGHCRPFDADARGTVPASGCGVVVLKRLSDAIEDDDTIHAVIRGFAVNNDGSGKVGYTAPSIDGQAQAIAMAHTMSDVDVESITYIEAHGTGTVLGDPIEVAALTQAFRAETEECGFCGLGSLKSNMGHMDTAAGVAGLIKTVLALEHQQIPPSLNFENPNPKIDFAASPFYVNDRLRDWETRNGLPRRAGISSFGIGGTNAHVVIEEAPATEMTGTSGRYQLLMLSARSESALYAASERLADYLRLHRELSLDDVAYTTQVGRKIFEHRLFVTAAGAGEAAETLASHDPHKSVHSSEALWERSCVFMFSGQGSQYPGMAHDLYTEYPVFAAEVDRCCESLREHLGLDLRTVMYPETEAAEDSGERLRQTLYAQCALFVVEYSLARLIMSWGVEPKALIGHSIGEYVAACLAGVFRLPDALRMVAVRAKAMQAQPVGVMVAVSMPVEDVATLLENGLVVAVVNAPISCVVSGTHDAMERFVQCLDERGIPCRRLHTSHAFHSPMMEPAMTELTAVAAEIELSAPNIPVISNLTGTWITVEQACDPAYWAKHMRHTVQFSAGVETLLKEEDRCYLELGPGNTLVSLVKQHDNCGQRCTVLPTLRHPNQQQNDVEFILGTVGRLWMSGMRLNWDGFHAGESRRRVPLPGYPFEGERYWVEPDITSVVTDKRSSQQTPEPIATKNPDIGSWFYAPVWQSEAVLTACPGLAAEESQCWLVFMDEAGLGQRLAESLEGNAGVSVIKVQKGLEFAETSKDVFCISPGEERHYRDLLDVLAAREMLPTRILHLWCLGRPDNGRTEDILDSGYYSLLYTVQSLVARSCERMRVDIIGDELQAVTGEEILCPPKAAILGLCKVIPQEQEHYICSVTDVETATIQDEPTRALDTALLNQLHAIVDEPVVAYRHHRRWVQRYQSCNVPPGGNGIPIRLREQGVYLITGGLGGVGMALAGYLARKAQARLVLTSRNDMPPPEDWNTWLAQHQEDDPTSKRIRSLQLLEQAGAEVMVARADVSDEESMMDLVTSVEARFGHLHGVLHAAGVVGGLSFAQLTKLHQESCELQFQSKIYGLSILDSVLSGKTLDFVMPVSSVSTVLGGLGLAAYSAANQYMDTLCHEKRRQGEMHWFVSNWDAWRFDDDAGKPAPAGSLAALSMTANEGCEVFDRLLRMEPVPQVVISTSDLNERLARWLRPEMPEQSTQEAQPSQSRHQRPGLATGYAEPETPAQEVLANIWQELFNIDQVGIYDNFLDLGGHSLLAIKAVSLIKERTGFEVPLARFLELGTVARLAAFIDQDGGADTGRVRETADREANQGEAQSEPQTTSEIQLVPDYFGGPDRQLFGLIRSMAAHRNTGVVLCHPYAHEYIRCHRALREIGSRLSRAGFPVLSFDYSGTGDSAGEYHEVRLTDWREDLERAIDYFRHACSLETVSLAGIRLGATLAMWTATQRDDVDAVAMWDPVVQGVDIEQELSEIARSQAMDISHQVDIERSDILAYPLTDEMKQDLLAIDLLELDKIHAQHVLVLENAVDGAGQRLVDTLRGSRTIVEHDTVADSGVWSREPFESIVPQEAIGKLVSWMVKVYQ